MTYAKSVCNKNSTEHNRTPWNNSAYYETSLLELSRELQKAVTRPSFMGPLTIKELTTPVLTMAVHYMLTRAFFVKVCGHTICQLIGDERGFLANFILLYSLLRMAFYKKHWVMLLSI
jgi:hypothetical protein